MSDQILKLYSKSEQGDISITTLPTPSAITITYFSKERLDAEIAKAREASEDKENFEAPNLPYAQVLDSENKAIVSLFSNQMAEILYEGIVINAVKP